jgi:ABC-2 type transport system permease protein
MRRSALRKYWKTAALSAAAYTGDSPLFALDYLLRLFRVALLLSLWRLILGDRGEAAGMTVGSLLTYSLMAETFAEPLACRTGLEVALWNGTIATRLVQPLSLAGQFGAEAAGKWGFGLLFFSLPLLFGAPLLGVDPRPADSAAALFFFPSLTLAVSVGLALEFVFGAVMVRLEQNVWAFRPIREAMTTLLSGTLVPLALLPWGLGGAFSWLPFASMASAPLRIYTGSGDPLSLLALQAAWAAILWPLSAWVWRSNHERLVCYGG